MSLMKAKMIGHKA